MFNSNIEIPGHKINCPNLCILDFVRCVIIFYFEGLLQINTWTIYKKENGCLFYAVSAIFNLKEKHQKYSKYSTYIKNVNLLKEISLCLKNWVTHIFFLFTKHSKGNSFVWTSCILFVLLSNFKTLNHHLPNELTYV